MASVLQSIFNIEKFQNRYDNELKDHAKMCTNEPANCWYCQLHKLADGILSGRYSQPKVNDDNVQYQEGIAPGMFKALVGKGHEEFSTMRQQDAFEFFQYFCKAIRQKEHASSSNDPTKLFDFMIEQRLQCHKCKKVKYQKHETSGISVNVPALKLKEDNGEGQEAYKSVSFYECLDMFIADETVEGYDCPNCKEKTTTTRLRKKKVLYDDIIYQYYYLDQSNLVLFPKYLLLIPVVLLSLNGCLRNFQSALNFLKDPLNWTNTSAKVSNPEKNYCLKNHHLTRGVLHLIKMILSN